MSRTIFARVAVFALFVLASLAIPGNAQAGGVCGGTYIVEAGETLDSIAARCGTTVSAILAANPGISTTLHTGQSLIVPGLSGAVPVTPTPYPPPTSTGTYIVQPGDTFSGIASRFGVTVSQLWAANPQVWNINVLYVGQVLYIPGASWGIAPTPTKELVPLSWGTVPAGAPEGKVKLSNQARGDVYVSLQGTTRDGLTVIREYPVSGSMTVKVPAGWYVYVAWVGGEKFVGQFNLRGDAEVSITFYKNKVVVE
ncbi:MAG: LysM peptidoglycan-binding domain-containing protein [Chloroflexota bacterium]